METTKTFQELGVSEEILRALEKKGVAMPTRVQEEAIPPLLAWRDVITKAPTGTGKTFAFGIPMIEHIDPQSDDLQGLILAPTRELAIQIADELRGLLTFYKDIRVTVVYGGQRLEPQIRSLQQHPWQRPVASWTTITARTCASTASRPSFSTRRTACWTWASSMM